MLLLPSLDEAVAAVVEAEATEEGRWLNPAAAEAVGRRRIEAAENDGDDGAGEEEDRTMPSTEVAAAAEEEEAEAKSPLGELPNSLSPSWPRCRTRFLR